MKTALVLLLAAGLGALPFNVLSLQAFVGVYTAVGVLVIAVQDYRRGATRGRRIVSRPVAAPSESTADAFSLAHTWGYQTISA